MLEIERRLTSTADPGPAHNFELHNLDYKRDEDVTTHAKKGEYKLFEDDEATKTVRPKPNCSARIGLRNDR